MEKLRVWWNGDVDMHLFSKNVVKEFSGIVLGFGDYYVLVRLDNGKLKTLNPESVQRSEWVKA